MGAICWYWNEVERFALSLNFGTLWFVLYFWPPWVQSKWLSVCAWKLLFYHGILWGTQDLQGCVLWEMLFFTMMNTHSKSIANNTIQVTQWDVNTSPSSNITTFFSLLHIREKSLSNYFFNELVSVWSFWKCYFPDRFNNLTIYCVI